jgi:hypothetical protein
MQKTSLKSAINQRIAYEKDLESFVADFKKENQLRLEKNTIKTGSRKIPLIPLEAVIAVDKK